MAERRLAELMHPAGGGAGSARCTQGRSLLSVVLVATVLVAVAGLGIPWPAGGQTPDSVRLGGEWTGLTIPLDSFLVVTTGPLPAVQVEAIVETVLPGARIDRDIDAATRVLAVDLTSRAALGAATLALTGHPDLFFAGFLGHRPSGGEPLGISGEIFVLWDPGVDPTTIDSVHTALALDVVQPPPPWRPGQYVVRVTTNTALDALQVSHALESTPGVTWAHPNALLPTTGTATPDDAPRAPIAGPGMARAPECLDGTFPNDTLYGRQWHLCNHVDPDIDIDAPGAWLFSRGSTDVTIAIIERHGFDVAQTDLVNQRWINPTPGDPPAGPFSKPGDDRGWSFQYCPDPSALPPHLDPCGDPAFTGALTHGTAVAGSAGAQADNTFGVASVCPECRLMLLGNVALTSAGYTLTDVLVAAIDYAHRMGADVINMSFGAELLPAVETALTDAVVDGRGGLGIPTTVSVPFIGSPTDICGLGGISAMDTLITVAPTTDQDTRWGGAMGPCLDLTAPGVDIWTLAPSNQIAARTGSSYAAPIVAGIAGLLISMDGTLTGDEVFTCLQQGAVDLGTPGWDEMFGYGRVDAARSMDDCWSLPPVGFPDPQTVCDTSEAEDYCASVWEVGLRAGFVRVDAGVAQSRSGLPAGGPLGDAVVYGTLFPSGSWLVDLQFGSDRLWGATDSSRTSAALLAAARLGSFYIGPSGAWRHESSNLAATTTRWGGGFAAGHRWLVGSYLATRVEVTYRRWSAPSASEYGVALGFGVRIF